MQKQELFGAKRRNSLLVPPFGKNPTQLVVSLIPLAGPPLFNFNELAEIQDEPPPPPPPSSSVMRFDRNVIMSRREGGERRATVRTIASTIRGGDTCKRILKGYTFTLLAARTMLYSRKFNLQGGKLEHLKWKKKTFSIPLLTLTQVLMNLCTREKCYFAIVARYFHSMD